MSRTLGDFGWPSAQSVPQSKIEAYLLNAAHPKNGGKAAFFQAFGWCAGEPRIFALALLLHARAETLVAEVVSPIGDVKLIFEGPMPAPDGRVPNVRTVWRVESRDRLAFITAVPLTDRRPRPALHPD